MNDNQLAELISSINKRFDDMDKRFEGVDKRFDDVDKTFIKMFKHIEDFRSEVNTKLDHKAESSSIDRLMDTMDNFIRQITDNNIENAARDAQFARLVEWARKVSKKTGVPLPNL